jgi:hypothetical protein
MSPPVEVLNCRASEHSIANVLCKDLLGSSKYQPLGTALPPLRVEPRIRFRHPVPRALNRGDFLSLRVRNGRQNTAGQENSLDNFSIALYCGRSLQVGLRLMPGALKAHLKALAECPAPHLASVRSASLMNTAGRFERLIIAGPATTASSSFSKVTPSEPWSGHD